MLKIVDQDCSRVNVTAQLMTVAGLTVLIGLVFLVIFKVKFFIEDRRMFKQFEKEQQNETAYEMWSPLYKSPISTFEVPKEMADSELK